MNFMLILCILTTGFIGWNVLYLLSGRKFNSLYAAEKLGLSILLGFGVISAQMFIMSLFGMGFTRVGILLPWAAVMVFNIVRYSRKIGTVLPNSLLRKHLWINSCGQELIHKCLRSKELGRTVPIFLVALITLQVCYNFFRAFMKPIEAYDAVAIYGLKAKMIYLAGGVNGDFFRGMADNFHGAHADYPLLISLSQAWIYTFLGSFNDVLVKIMSPLFYLSFLLIFYAVLKRITQKRTISLAFTFALASIKQFSDYATIGVADLALGIYFSVAAIFLYLWFKSGEWHFFNISLCSSILCLWTKNEGVLLSLILVSVFFLYTITKRRKQEFFIYALVVALFILSWGAFKNANAPANENFNLGMLAIQNLKAGMGRLPVIFYEYQKQLFGFKKWNIAWVLLAVLFFKKFRQAFSGDVKYISAVLFIFLSGYTLVYMFSAVEIDFFLRKTFSRFLLHILPVAAFWAAIVYEK